MTNFKSLVSTVLLGLSYAHLAAAAIGPVADLTITDGDVTPDGFTRPAVLSNGQMPGPLIKGNTGDNFQINVIDNLTDDTMLTATTIHWHGFFQSGTNWADGPAFVNQCPISAENSFLYDFSSKGQAGTFWYHSHLSTQYCDGLRGPFVVYDPNDPHASLYDVDDESTVITLVDWYHTQARLGPRFPFGADATLINGLGRSTSSAGAVADLAVIHVTQGKRYRFRLVSLSCDPNYMFSIDNHTMTIIEADSVNHQPLTVDQIQIFASQRYSFVLTADKDIDNYWIRARPNIGTTSFDGGINSAILRYDGAPEIEPTTESSTTMLLNQVDLVPLTDLAAPGEPTPGGVDLAINMAFSFNGTNFAINGASFTPPTVPVLLQIMSGALDASALMPTGSVYTLPSNATIELSFPVTSTNAPGAPHPFHLHGHTFHVVRSAGQTDYNYVNPPQRDAVSTGTAGDNVTIRFRTNNPGPWFLHCHIDFHLEAGFAVVMAEDPAHVALANPIPSAWDDLCPTYNAKYVSS
ncbi:laccase [Epithele typhae]|uniref:laccase n=1 Tax=Epithele typhae TaxID=378194 RepID=UPI002008CD04|nr:laccase [Epithele typhae]KAH9942363.1 laccase [Epithele typhae]